jgi:hypothetical protein
MIPAFAGMTTTSIDRGLTSCGSVIITGTMENGNSLEIRRKEVFLTWE